MARPISAPAPEAQGLINTFGVVQFFNLMPTLTAAENALPALVAGEPPAAGGPGPHRGDGDHDAGAAALADRSWPSSGWCGCARRATPGCRCTSRSGLLVTITVLGVLMGVLAAIVPTRRAARRDPLTALRYE